MADKADGKIVIEMSIDDSDGRKKLKELKNEIESIKVDSIKVKVDLDSSDINQEINKIQDKVESSNSVKVKTELPPPIDDSATSKLNDVKESAQQLSTELAIVGNEVREDVEVIDASFEEISSGIQKTTKTIDNDADVIDASFVEIVDDVKKVNNAVDDMGRKTKKSGTEATQAWKKVGDEVERTSKKAKESSNSVSGAMGKMKSSALKLGKLLAGAFAVSALVRFGKECIDLGSDLTEVQNVVDTVFPEMNAQLEQFSKNAMTQFGLSETMAKKYASTFGAMAKAMGFTEQQAYDLGTSLTGLAGDVASFYNITQDEAYTKLKGVFTGESEPLKELG